MKRLIKANSRIALLLIILLAGGLYLYYSWHGYDKLQAEESLQLARSLATLLPTGHILNFPGEGAGQEIDLKMLVKEKFHQLVQETSSINYAFLLGETNGDIYLLLDSNPTDNGNYWAPEQFKALLAEKNWVPFQSENPVFTKAMASGGGSWLQALIPIEDKEKGEIAVILGLSFSSASWRRNIWQKMIPDLAVVLSLAVLLYALYKVNGTNAKLAYSEALYRNLVENAPIGIAVCEGTRGVADTRFLNFNPVAEEILNSTNSFDWQQLTHSEDLERELTMFEHFINQEIPGYTIEKRLKRPDGEGIWVNVKIASFIPRSAEKFTYLCLIEDISERKTIEKNLQESERSKAVLLSHLPGMAFRSFYDKDWTFEFVSEGCFALTGYKQAELVGSEGYIFNEIIAPEYRDLVAEKWARAVERKQGFSCEYEIITKSGGRKWVLELGQAVYSSTDAVTALEGIVFDISQQKKREQRIAYLSEHDFLTGLYNRHYLDQVKQNFAAPENQPFAVMICDINGLRMINDAYGHAQGDRLIVETARLIQSCCGAECLATRISGGEFLILIPKTSTKKIEKLAFDIQNKVEAYNRSSGEKLGQLNLAVGWAVAESDCQNIEDVIKAAENFLKSRKLLTQTSSHHSIIASIMATLYAKSQETEEHGQRLAHYASLIGEELGLEQKDLDDLRLLSMLHDIGKIGVDDSILNKPGKLTATEWEEMKKHPKIGFRIAMSTPQLSHIADFILYHHERYDGTGYPAGLKGEEIPLLSRIISIADAYDAMLEERVYRKAISPREAQAELARCAGSQFDPELVEVFLAILQTDAADYKSS